jgi:hypothetical protein
MLFDYNCKKVLENKLPGSYKSLWYKGESYILLIDTLGKKSQNDIFSDYASFFNAMTLSITTVSIMTLSIMTLSILDCQHDDTKHNRLQTLCRVLH